MRALCVYVDGGKGHYVPAKAIADALNAVGIETEIEELFDYLDAKWLGRINKKWWREMLKHPHVERKLSKYNDQESNGMGLGIRFANRHLKYVLKSNLYESPVDFIVATHPYCSTVLSAMLKKFEIKIPVYYFATDVFNAPKAAISKDIRRFLISTNDGKERVIAMGQNPDSVQVVAFPLQKSIIEAVRLSKSEARAKLGLDQELFTIQLNLGGEGIGNIKLLERIIEKKYRVQVVVIGGINASAKKHLSMLSSKAVEHGVKLVIAGFVNNVNEYLDASDIVVGRAGINTIVESIYYQRPFMITELVYTVIPSADFIEKYKVGWNATDDIEKQLDIVLRCIEEPGYLESMNSNFSSVPISYGADKLVEFLLKDYQEYQQANLAN